MTKNSQSVTRIIEDGKPYVLKSIKWLFEESDRGNATINLYLSTNDEGVLYEIHRKWIASF